MFCMNAFQKCRLYYLNIPTNDSNLGILYMLTFIPPCSFQVLAANLEGVRNINCISVFIKEGSFYESSDALQIVI